MSRLLNFILGCCLLSSVMEAGAQPILWRAYCIDESRHLGGFYFTESDASLVATSHTVDTDHSTRIFQQERLSIVDSPAVKAIQRRLATLGHRVGKPDGIMGPRTIAGVARFQASAKLPVSGKLDAETIAKLHDERLEPAFPVQPQASCLQEDDVCRGPGGVVYGNCCFGLRCTNTGSYGAQCTKRR